MAPRLLKAAASLSGKLCHSTHNLRRKRSMMKKFLVTLAVLVVAAGAYAQSELGAGNANVHKFMVRGYAGGGGGGTNLVNHGGPVMVSPKVVCIFWGFGNGDLYTAAMQSFRTTG